MINLSRLKWAVLVLFMFPVLLYLSYIFYWYAKSVVGEQALKQNFEIDKSTKTLAPDELSSQFNPSENTGVYKVQDLDLGNGRMTLIGEWPPEQRGSRINPTISCQIWDSKLFELGSKVPRFVSDTEMLKVIDSTPKEQLLFMGICSDIDCQTVSEGCILKIIEPKYEPK
ncbi:MAG: hypothetical protein WAV40_01490 [Microgenomates group bacterium]